MSKNYAELQERLARRGSGDGLRGAERNRREGERGRSFRGDTLRFVFLLVGEVPNTDSICSMNAARFICA